MRKWTGVAPSAVMQTYPLSPSREGIPSLTSRGQIGFPTITPEGAVVCRGRHFRRSSLPRRGRQCRLPVAAANRATSESRKNLFTWGSKPSQLQNRSKALFSVFRLRLVSLPPPISLFYPIRFWNATEKCRLPELFFDLSKNGSGGHRGSWI